MYVELKKIYISLYHELFLVILTNKKPKQIFKAYPSLAVP